MNLGELKTILTGMKRNIRLRIGITDPRVIASTGGVFFKREKNQSIASALAIVSRVKAKLTSDVYIWDAGLGKRVIMDANFISLNVIEHPTKADPKAKVTKKPAASKAKKISKKPSKAF